MRLAAAIAGLAVLGVVSGFIVLGWLLSRPAPARIGLPPADLDVRPVEFASRSGSRVHAWFGAPRAGSDGVVILLPGVRANRTSMVERARFLHLAGYGVLLIDFQATGESPGSVISFGWRERYDVLGAVDFVRTALPNAKVAIIGSSLGGAAALLAVPGLAVDGLVLEAVYPSIEEATRNRLRIRLGSMGDLAAPLLLMQLHSRIGARADQLRPIDAIPSVRFPVFIINGSRDRRTTSDDARALFAAARSPKTFWLVEGAAHVDLYRFAPAEYRRRILEFLESALGAPAAK